MVNCAFCRKEIERNVFCSPSHKVMFHQGKADTKLTEGQQPEVEMKNTPTPVEDKVFLYPQPKKK